MWIVVGVAALFVAYVVGRAVGILLDLNPYVTEVVAMALVVAAGAARFAGRGARAGDAEQR
jgi:uncharacterized membrane protein